MIPRREITTGPESFSSSASSVRTGGVRPPATEDAWPVGRSMMAAPGFQRGADTGARGVSRQAKLGAQALTGRTRDAEGTFKDRRSTVLSPRDGGAPHGQDCR